MGLPDFAVRASVYSPGLRMPRHSHDYTNITIVTGGAIEEAAARGRYAGVSGSVVFKPAGSEHENVVCGFGARTLTLEFRRDGRFAAESRSRPWSWYEQPEIVRAAISLLSAVHGRGDIEAAACGLVKIVLAEDVRDEPSPEWMRVAKAALENSFDAPLRFDDLARRLGFHPVYMSRAFHRHTGNTMGDHVRNLRLRRARQLLTTTNRPIATIASLCGFTDSSHLCRTFARGYAITPAAYRELHRKV